MIDAGQLVRSEPFNTSVRRAPFHWAFDFPRLARRSGGKIVFEVAACRNAPRSCSGPQSATHCRNWAAASRRNEQRSRSHAVCHQPAAVIRLSSARLHRRQLYVWQLSAVSISRSWVAGSTCLALRHYVVRRSAPALRNLAVNTPTPAPAVGVLWRLGKTVIACAGLGLAVAAGCGAYSRFYHGSVPYSGRRHRGVLLERLHGAPLEFCEERRQVGSSACTGPQQ
jgi:hypothetical protein